MYQSSRLQELAALIDERSVPLGSDFQHQCWGAVARDVASEHASGPCDYFGFSDDVYAAMIRLNASLPEGQRNAVMAGLTRSLADTVPAVG